MLLDGDDGDDDKYDEDGLAPGQHVCTVDDGDDSDYDVDGDDDYKDYDDDGSW